MNGQLSEHPLAELISEIAAKGFSGALRIERERVKAVVYFEDGALVYAASNLRVHRLVEHLRQQGLTIMPAHESLADVALAEALVSAGLVTRPRLNDILVEHVTNIVRVALLWADGSWTFDGRAHANQFLQAKVPTRQLLLEATRRIEMRFAGSRFPGGNETLYPVPDAANSLILVPAEAFLLSRVDAPISVANLIALSGLREAEAIQGIYGLTLAGVLKRECGPLAFRTAPPQPVKSKAAATKLPEAAREEEKVAAPKADPRRELDAFLERLAQASNHYEVLNVPISADLAEIKRMYHTIARNFHPDRFHDLAGTNTHIRLQSSFARITQAYEVLTSTEQRSIYDGNLQALRRVREAHETKSRASEAATEGAADQSENGNNVAQLAEKRFQEGAVALQQGQTGAATSCFSAAARLAPNEAKYRAYFGRALAANPKTQRLAEAELQAAVKLDPGNASYHLMLAVLYRNLGFPRRAVTEVERALVIDPQNSHAQQLLSSLAANK